MVFREEFIKLCLEVFCPSIVWLSVHSMQAYRSRNLSLTNSRPILPKHTQLQNNTLAIHAATPTPSECSSVSKVVKPSTALAPPATPAAVTFAWIRLDVGTGITLGLTKNRTTVPMRPIAALSVKPALVRSSKYQRKGFARASVRLS